MKGTFISKLLCVLLLVGIIATWASVALAYEPPTANATDVILWYGDNLTISAANITITGLEDAMVAAAEAQSDAIVEGQIEIANTYLVFLIIATLFALAFWQKNILLYALGLPVGMAYGLSLAASADVNSPLWVGGIVIAIIGTYCLFKAVTMGLERSKRKRESD